MPSLNNVRLPRPPYRGRVWHVVIAHRSWDIEAPTKGEARALLKGFLGQPIPPGVEFVEVLPEDEE